MSIVLICLASLVTAFYIAAPFWRARREKNAPRSGSRDASRALSSRKAALASLEARRDNLLREIKDLEFDRRMGKVEPDEYSAMRGELTSQAKAVLVQIEALRAKIAAPQTKSKPKSAPLEKPTSRQLESDVENEILIARARRQRELDIESEVLISRARRRLAQKRSPEAARWRCDCGRTMQASDAFCASCGAPRPREIAVVTA